MRGVAAARAAAAREAAARAAAARAAAHRVEILLAGLARGVTVARVLVGEDVHLHTGAAGRRVRSHPWVGTGQRLRSF